MRESKVKLLVWKGDGNLVKPHVVKDLTEGQARQLANGMYKPWRTKVIGGNSPAQRGAYRGCKSYTDTMSNRIKW